MVKTSPGGKALVVYIAILSTQVISPAISALPKNATLRHFEILCQVYKFAGAAQNINLALGAGDNQTNTRSAVAQLLLFLTDPKRVNLDREHASNDSKGGDPLFEGPLGTKLVEDWRKLPPHKGDEANRPWHPRLLETERPLKLARRKIWAIYGQTVDLEGELEAKRKEAQGDLDEAKATLREVVIGSREDLTKGETTAAAKKYGGEGSDAAAERGKVCGSVTGDGTVTPGTAAGQNLIIDTLCLCAKGNSNDADDACGTATKSLTQWNAGKEGDTSSHGASNWAKIKESCKIPTTPLPIHHGWSTAAAFKVAIAAGFHHLTDTSVPASLSPALGACDQPLTTLTSAGVKCNGKNDSQGGKTCACVIYASTTPEEHIPWLRKFETALRSLEELEKHKNQVAALKDRTKELQSRAEQVYDEAKAALEIEGAPGKASGKGEASRQTPSNPSDKTTAQEAAGVSKAASQRLILPWTLLL